MRDMNLIRLILLRLDKEERPFGYCSFSSHDPDFAIEGFTPDEVDLHLRHLYDAGYIDSGTNVHGSMDGSWYFKCLTWEGHDFVDSVSHPETWEKTKGVLNKAGGWTAKLISEVAKQIIKSELQKHGVPLS